MISNVVVPAETDVLSSWKEIASYLGRGVRTAQRWEAELQMPVHRPWGKDHSAVIAMKSEIDQWIRSCSREKRERQLAAARATRVASDGAVQPSPLRSEADRAFCRELLVSSRTLRAEVARNRVMLRDSIEDLWKTLSSMSGEGERSSLVPE